MKKFTKFFCAIAVIIFIVAIFFSTFFSTTYNSFMQKVEQSIPEQMTIEKYGDNTYYQFEPNNVRDPKVLELYDPDNTFIPERFSLKEELNIPVVNQGSQGLCVGFAMTKSIETNYALKYGEYIDLSEMYIDFIATKNDIENRGQPTKDKAGNITKDNKLGGAMSKSIVYKVASTYGIAADTGEATYIMASTKYKEAYNKMIKEGSKSKILNATPVVKLSGNENMIRIENRDKMKDAETIEAWNEIMKIHIMKYGSLFTSIKIKKIGTGEFDEKGKEITESVPVQINHHFNENLKSFGSHAVSIIGWDDNYSRDNFEEKPSRDGAFIVLNSWGESWGDNGCFYIPYDNIYDIWDVNGVLDTEKVVNGKTESQYAIQSVAISQKPYISVYSKNQSLDLEGGKILIKYNGRQEVISMKSMNVKVTGYDPSKIGEQTLQVSYKDKKAGSFKIQVKEKIQLPNKIELSFDNKEFNDYFEKEMEFGKKFKLSARISPTNIEEAYKKIIWNSNDKNLATVDQQGNVTIKSAQNGKVTITAKTANKITAKAVIDVVKKSVTDIKLYYGDTEIKDNARLILPKDSFTTLKVKVFPNDATHKEVTWTLDKSAEKIVKMGKDNGTERKINPKKEGEDILTVETSNGMKKRLIIQVVSDGGFPQLINKSEIVQAEKLELDITKMNIFVGESLKLTGKITPSNVTNQEVAWSSSDLNIASASNEGNVTANKAGTATITARTTNNKSAQCVVTIKEKQIAVTGVMLSSSTETIEVGKTLQLKATVTPSDATNQAVTYNSSNSNIAAVDRNTGLVTAKAVGSATITVTTKEGGKIAACKVTVKAATIAVTGVNLNPTTGTIEVGKTLQLNATVTPSNATNKAVAYTSSNTKIATVDKDTGLVTAKAVGSAIITVTTKEGSKTASSKVTVKAPNNNLMQGKQLIGSPAPSSGIYKFSKNKSQLWEGYKLPSGILKAGEMYVLKYKIKKTGGELRNVGGDSQHITPISFTIDGKQIDKAQYGTSYPANNLNNDNKEHVVEFKFTYDYGDVYIQPNRGKGLAVNAEISDVTITKSSDKKVAVTKVNLDKTKGTIEIGKTLQLKATVTPTNATYQAVTYSTSNKNIATVSNTGLVTAKAVGSVMITVTTKDGSKTAQCVVTVQEPTVAVTSIKLNQTTGTIDIGKNLQLKATVEPSSATNKTVTYSSSNESIATVNNAGLITAKGVGKATITAKTANNKIDQCVVTVKSPTVAVTSVKLNQTTGTIYIGKTLQLKATITPTNATNQTVTYSSNNGNVATVNNAGLVTAQGVGSATITVKTANNKTAQCVVTVKPIVVVNNPANNLMQGKQLIGSPAPNNGVYAFSKNNSQLWAGYKLPTNILAKGKTYVLRYKIKRTGGELRNIGGDSQHITPISFTIDGKQIDKTQYGKSYPANNLNNDNVEHIVEFKFTYSYGDIYIQPNRGKGLAVNAAISDVTIFEDLMGSKQLIGSPAPNNGAYAFSKNNSQLWAGYKLPTNILAKGKTYVLRYKIKRTGGELRNIGGDSQHITPISFTIDGKQIDKTQYGKSYPANNLNNDNVEHIVEFKFTYSYGDIYIQPNRGKGLAVNAAISDVTIFQAK